MSLYDLKTKLNIDGWELDQAKFLITSLKKVATRVAHARDISVHVEGRDGEGEAPTEKPLRLSALYKGLVKSLTADIEGRLNVNTVTENVRYYGRRLENSSGQSNMNVDGSVTPVVFEYAPPAGQQEFLETISSIFSDEGTFSLEGFGNRVSPLTNGILMTIRSNGSTYDAIMVKNTSGFFGVFAREPFLIENSGLNSNEQLYAGVIDFTRRLILDGDKGDFIRISIRDNLSFLTRLEVVCKTFIPVPL